MTQRRSLMEGLTPAVDPEAAARFIYGESDPPKEASKAIGTKPVEIFEKRTESTTLAASSKSPRTHLTTRLRTDLAEALKRASLERQLAGQTPHTVQDILEEALTPWLREQGYL